MDISTGAVSRSVVINAASCTSLLSSTVSRTSGYSIDRLLRLHHQMSLMIYQHRHSYDKTALLQVHFYYCFLSMNQVVLCEYSKFQIESNSYFSIRFDSKRAQLFEIFEYLSSPISYLFNRMTPIFQLSNHA